MCITALGKRLLKFLTHLHLTTARDCQLVLAPWRAKSSKQTRRPLQLLFFATNFDVSDRYLGTGPAQSSGGPGRLETSVYVPRLRSWLGETRNIYFQVPVCGPSRRCTAFDGSYPCSASSRSLSLEAVRGSHTSSSLFFYQVPVLFDLLT